MGLMRVFSGSEVLAIALQQRLEEAGIETTKKDNIQSARLGGFGATDLAIKKKKAITDLAKAHSVIDDFKTSI